VLATQNPIELEARSRAPKHRWIAFMCALSLATHARRKKAPLSLRFEHDDPLPPLQGPVCPGQELLAWEERHYQGIHVD